MSFKRFQRMIFFNVTQIAVRFGNYLTPLPLCLNPCCLPSHRCATTMPSKRNEAQLKKLLVLKFALAAGLITQVQFEQKHQEFLGSVSLESRAEEGEDVALMNPKRDPMDDAQVGMLVIGFVITYQT